MNGLIAKTPLPVPLSALLGAGVLVYGGWVLYSVFTQWERFRRRHPSLSRWGRGSFGFPASRVGVLYGTLTCMLLGLMLISRVVEWSIPAEWRRYLAIGILCWIALIPFVALRDYFLHRASRRK
ncbi:hypothetical protein [Prosthecobacter sp.]|uniref:hypothetical protein n=1 Tax=Prosthecobacter sp. TaxID=1965333 RepID=UPI0037843CB6